MIGAYTVGKKAVTFGYKRYGIPGAVASGGAALVGYLIVRRALESSTNDRTVDSAIDASEIRSAVAETGLGAVTEKETLERVIDEEQVDTRVDMADVQSSAEDETEEVADSAGGDDSNPEKS
ncbi:hypothetical protein [Natrinema pallidum]|uniref:Uncharacterized protein n=2 Tax=Natrinema pallidum TaxID=69527 RepID=L9YT38_9EURY|nr:hypothetical protein [Natrinema pallidum]ELY76851.1 hypothetical protein C487_10132 [Natrinema pallidum DSM 3751]QCW03256.1 hypothetical protein FGF80_08410 [Natrinema pallidum]